VELKAGQKVTLFGDECEIASVGFDRMMGYVDIFDRNSVRLAMPRRWVELALQGWAISPDTPAEWHAVFDRLDKQTVEMNAKAARDLAERCAKATTTDKPSFKVGDRVTYARNFGIAQYPMKVVEVTPPGCTLIGVKVEWIDMARGLEHKTQWFTADCLEHVADDGMFGDKPADPPTPPMNPEAQRFLDALGKRIDKKIADADSDADSDDADAPIVREG
jgi:hypothetical protein